MLLNVLKITELGYDYDGYDCSVTGSGSAQNWLEIRLKLLRYGAVTQERATFIG